MPRSLSLLVLVPMSCTVFPQQQCHFASLYMCCGRHHTHVPKLFTLRFTSILHVQLAIPQLGIIGNVKKSRCCHLVSIRRLVRSKITETKVSLLTIQCITGGWKRQEPALSKRSVNTLVYNGCFTQKYEGFYTNEVRT